MSNEHADLRAMTDAELEYALASTFAEAVKRAVERRKAIFDELSRRRMQEQVVQRHLAGK